ncbi:MAG: hypothetical protein WC915_01330 [archaeon]|jgi:hypothetical protein
MIKRRNVLLAGLNAAKPVEKNKIINNIRVNRLAKVIGLIPGKIPVEQRGKKIDKVMSKKSPQEQEELRALELNRSLRAGKKRK